MRASTAYTVASIYQKRVQFSFFLLALFNKFVLFSLVSGDGSAPSPMGSTHLHSTLNYDSYAMACHNAEKIVRTSVEKITVDNKRAPAQLLRLLFHDCFTKGCDASVMLDDSNGMGNHPIERDAIPNKTLKGFDFIDTIKSLLEAECPGIVSCSDILVMATRDAIVLSDGPYYPVLTGRHDSTRSYFNEALAQIPNPNGNISDTLRLFGLRGFNEREVVALLGGHNIGKIGCEFILPRINKTNPDPSIPFDFLMDMRTKCHNDNASVLLAPSSGDGFDSHYYQTVLRGKGLLKADQELMANEETAKAVFEYARDSDKFRLDFARAMIKLSNLNVLVGSGGEVRRNCSMLNNS